MKRKTPFGMISEGSWKFRKRVGISRNKIGMFLGVKPPAERGRFATI
jgi:hypothetical protein